MKERRVPQNSVVKAFKNSQPVSIADAIGEGGVEELIERTKYNTGKKAVLFKMRKQPVNKGKRPAAKRKRCK